MSYILVVDMEESPSQPPPSSGIRFMQQTPLLEAVDWLLTSPSIPLTMRKQFYALWESVIFGNYEDKDIKLLYSKFREWCILFKWYIPEQKWGNILSYIDADIDEVFETDLNLLLNMLEQLYYINLTRGREGFTVKELTTFRSIQRSSYEEDIKKKKKGWHLF